MKKQKISFALILLLTICSISVWAQKTTINGKIENNKFTQVSVQIYDDKGTAESTKINPDGTFKLTVNIPQTDIYKLVFDENGERLMMCLSPNQQIELTLDANNISTIKSVKGSPSIEFCMRTVELINSSNKLLDSVNKALQTDKEIQFYNEFQSQFKPFLEANTEADEYCVKVAQNTDSLQRFVNSKLIKGKVDSKDLDAFIYIGSNLLKEIATNYTKYTNYMQSMSLLNDFKSNRNPKFTSFYESTVDKYLEFIDQRNNTMSNSFSNFVAQTRNYLFFRDSLQINDLGNKKKDKELMAEKIIELAHTCQNVQETEKDLSSYGKAADGFGKYAMQDAQRKASTIVQKYQKFFDDEFTKRTDVVVNHLLANKNDLAVLMFIDNYPRDKYETLHKEVALALNEKYPKHPIVAQRYKTENSPATATSVGALAPDLAFENPDGKILKLSDLRGKVVLLDFWASWCGPCRKENPNVVTAYKKFHDKGFEIFSVSLDKDKARWVKAIEDDGLIWPNHVSDLGFWESKAAKIYGISAIPATFLIGKDGKIIAKNLRGAALENTLKEILE